MTTVHIAVTRRVKPGCEAEFEAALREFVRESITGPGMTGVHLIAPGHSSGNREYGVLRSFESEAAGREFYSSPLYEAWQWQIGPLSEGEPIRRKLHGLESYFHQPHHDVPPRWKMACVTWLGVFPTVLVWSLVLPRLLTGVPWLAAVAISNAFVVATLAWIAMPLLTRAFTGWLHRPDPPAPAPGQIPVPIPLEAEPNSPLGSHAVPPLHTRDPLLSHDHEAI